MEKILEEYDFGEPGELGKCKYVDGQAREEIKSLIVKIAKQYTIPPEIFLAQMLHESAETLNPRIEGDSGIYGDEPVSFGIGQVNTVAHPDFSKERAFYGGYNKCPDIEYELNYSANFLNRLRKKWGSWASALRSYNGSGPMAIAYSKLIMSNAQKLKDTGEVPN